MMPLMIVTLVAVAIVLIVGLPHWRGCVLECNPTRRVDLTMAGAMEPSDVEERFWGARGFKRWAAVVRLMVVVPVLAAVSFPFFPILKTGDRTLESWLFVLLVGWLCGLILSAPGVAAIYWAAGTACLERRPLTLGSLPFVVGVLLVFAGIWGAVAGGVVAGCWFLMLGGQGTGVTLNMLAVGIALPIGFIGALAFINQVIRAWRRFLRALPWSEDSAS